MSSPLFSVLLPTRNRAPILGGAIASVLGQTCADFELIVSDNDPSPDATRLVVEKFVDPRLRYFRTSGQLPMHENWEFALQHARGKFIVVLEDKQHFTPTALATLRPVCEAHPRAVVSFPFILARGDTLDTPAPPPAPQRLTCESVIEEFCCFSVRYWQIFPRGFTSCGPRWLFDEMRRTSPTGLVFSWINPDYAHAFQSLSHADELVFLDTPISFVPRSVAAGGHSNGLKTMTSKEAALKFYATVPVAVDEILAAVPVKAIKLWPNSVLHDFRKFYRRAGHAPQVDWVRYHGQCLHLILMGLVFRGDMREEIAAVWRSCRERGVAFTARVALNFLARCGRSAVDRVRNRFRY